MNADKTVFCRSLLVTWHDHDAFFEEKTSYSYFGKSFFVNAVFSSWHVTAILEITLIQSVERILCRRKFTNIEHRIQLKRQLLKGMHHLKIVWKYIIYSICIWQADVTHVFFHLSSFSICACCASYTSIRNWICCGIWMLHYIPYDRNSHQVFKDMAISLYNFFVASLPSLLLWEKYFEFVPLQL